jgi:hypothetical protein
MMGVNYYSGSHRVPGYSQACLSLPQYLVDELTYMWYKRVYEKRVLRWKFLSWVTSHVLGCATLLASCGHSTRDQGWRTSYGLAFLIALPSGAG